MEFEKQGDYATIDGWIEFEKQGDYATMRRGWMWSLKSKETMRQCDNAKGMDVDFEKQGDYATTQQCDNAKGMDVEFEKQGDNATMRRGWMWSLRSKETMRQRECHLYGVL